LWPLKKTPPTCERVHQNKKGPPENGGAKGTRERDKSLKRPSRKTKSGEKICDGFSRIAKTQGKEERKKGGRKGQTEGVKKKTKKDQRLLKTVRQGKEKKRRPCPGHWSKKEIRRTRVPRLSLRDLKRRGRLGAFGPSLQHNGEREKRNPGGKERKRKRAGKIIILLLEACLHALRQYHNSVNIGRHGQLSACRWVVTHVPTDS